jgi:hypothetical protein
MRRHRRRVLILVIAAFAAGLLVGRGVSSSPQAPVPVVATQDVSVVTVTEGTETVTLGG